jgi:CMP-N,N'-diacetyllegionaminic acid synthase
VNKKEEKVVVFIPARTTSKRVPEKNIAHINNLPLFIHSVRVANQLKNIEAIFLSTESEQVIDLSRDENCVVLERDSEVLEYEATNYDVMLNAIPKINEHLGYEVDILILLQPTHPFRSPIEIDNALEIIRKNKSASSLISVKKLDEAIGTINDDGYWNSITNLSAKTRQKENETYQNTGNFYIFRKKYTFDKNDLFGERVIAYPLALPNVDVNIDYPYQLQLAKTIHEHGFDLLGLDYNPVSDKPLKD